MLLSQLLHLQQLQIHVSCLGHPSFHTQRENAGMGETTAHDFRSAMRALASAVSIVSTASGTRRFGMTATAVTSLSADPPSLLVCINRAASLHSPLLESGIFCVNILHAWQSALAQTFGSKDVDRFAHGDWRADERTTPYLADAQANLFCEVDDVHPYGTHSIVIGKIYRIGVRGPVHPLVYQDGRYTVGLAEGVDWVIPIAG
jgi:flavin reductase (DIM6/NTAB) family NADH-FMN oxidoreductase RutF